MKAEHRKELETNALATKINEAYDRLKQGPSRTTWIWLGVLGGGILVVLLFRYFMNSSEANDSARWTNLDNVVFGEQLDEFIENKDYKDTTQGRIARFKEARVNLSDGLRLLGPERDKSLKRIEKATDLYEDLLKSPGKVPLLHQEALWGAAKGNEVLGNIDKAKTHYEKLIKEYPSSALGLDAEKQLKRLDSDDPLLKELNKEFGAGASRSANPKMVGD